MKKQRDWELALSVSSVIVFAYIMGIVWQWIGMPLYVKIGGAVALGLGVAIPIIKEV